MAFSTCSSADFFHPEFKRYCDMFSHPVIFHRKLWEWVFILHHAYEAGVLRPGARALAFGCGTEPLPAVFAASGMTVHATDAPFEIGLSAGWMAGNQLAAALASIPSGSLSRDEFEKKVSFSTCDMNNINPDLTDFDLCWSACALEHLGSLKNGIEFIVNSVEKTLSIGGVAIHTTELNLSSNHDTVDHTGCVLYRRKDLEKLISRLREAGHHVTSFSVAPDSRVMDNYVDVPPYDSNVHLKLRLGEYVSTSVGLVVKRGR